MTVPSTVTRTTYSGDGASVAFSVPFYFLTNADIVVLLVDADGNSTTQVLTTNYTLAGAGVEAGGTVTMVVAPPSGYELVIYREPAVTQLTDYAPNDPFPAESHERALDRLTMICQRLKELVTRSFRLADSDTSGASTILPSPEPLKVIGWGNDGLSLVNTDASALATVVTAGNPIYEMFDGDGATLAFMVSSPTLGSLPATRVFVSGVRQSPGTDYTISGDTVTFAVAPPSGTENILVEWTDAIAAVGVPSDGSVTLEKLPDGLFSVSAAALLKFADGFFAASAAARAKFADGFVTLAKLATDIFSGATTVTIVSADKVVFSDTSDSGNTKVGLVSDIVTLAAPTYATNAEYVTGTETAKPLSPAVARARNLVQGTVVTASGTSIDFTGLPSWVKRITVMLNGVSTNGTSRYQLQLGTSGVVVATGYLSTAGSIGTGANATNSSGVITTGCVLNGFSPTIAVQQTGAITITALTGNTWVFSGTLIDSAGVVASNSIAGTVTLSGALDRLRLTANGTDTFDAGSINIIYE